LEIRENNMAEELEQNEAVEQPIESIIESSSIEIELTVREVNFLLGLLAKQPYENVAEVINNIRTQGLPQVQALERKHRKAAND
jgi:hypothetical protein